MKICLAILLSVVLLSANAFAEDFARVLSVTQGVSYALNGKSEALAVKMDVPIKADIASDATGKAQMIFPDDSTLTIAPNTKIMLSEYTDTENEENILLNLVSGTARIITGESNRRNPQAFTVNTPQASIGIRGTLVTIQASGDLTRVYLTETSGLGVSVRNLNTGKIMELRKPGRIITVGPDFMEERKAQKEEAAAFNAALRGKSLLAQKREREERLSNMPATSLASGTLPPAGLGEITQAAAFERDGILSHATLVADNRPARPIIPAIPAADPAAPTTPVVAPVVPEVPATPVTPEVPDVPDPVLPNPPVDEFIISDFSIIAGAKFETENASYNFYLNNEKVEPATLLPISRTLELTMPKSYDSYENDTFINSTYDNCGWFLMPQYKASSNSWTAADRDLPNSEIKTNGEFKMYSGTGFNLEGKIISSTLIRVDNARKSTYEGGGSDNIIETRLNTPVEMPRTN